jgi:hypothetical protein
MKEKQTLSSSVSMHAAMFDLTNHYNAHAFRVVDSKTAPMCVNKSLRDLQNILLEDFFLVI